MKSLRVFLIIVGALALQTTLARFLVRGSIGVDLVLVAVVYIGLTSGPTVGIVAGTAAGLAQDALAVGVVGIGGLAKTIVGYLAGVIGTTFIVTQALPRFLVFFCATILQSAVFAGFHALLDPEAFSISIAGTIAQAFGNALVGIVVFQLAEGVPGTSERRAARGRNRR